MRSNKEARRIAAALAVLETLGAPAATRRQAERELTELVPDAWTCRVLVTPEGTISPLLGGDAHGYAIDLGAIDATLGQHRRRHVAA